MINNSLEVELQLWQSYLDIGLQQQIWSDRLCTMAKTNDFKLCQQYVITYIQNIKQQLNECQLELSKQSQPYRMTTLPFDQIDDRLKETVDHERKYLSTRNNNQLLKFKDDIHEKELFRIIFTYRLTTDQRYGPDSNDDIDSTRDRLHDVL
ncbi:unnamed protein product [Didymodactylos carnosus]|uniref:Uncharacterized protein n=1 Tax=Didymodactylos carnosus TaxID=1234261 RepID=A0A813YY14_9BILA|nr:unnamed protein product [Didymodactylos carnosus]CAF3675532.1 unnamed protein product [Didymodactylos carnosus]